MKNSQQQRKRRANRRKDVATVLPGFPRQVLAQPTFTRTFRYISTAGESKDADVVTYASLQNLMFIGIASSSARAMFATVRLRKVEIWGCSTSSSFSTVGLTWLGARTSNKSLIASGNSFVPAHVVARPPKGSDAAMWFSGQEEFVYGTPTKSNICFSLQCTAGDICDVTVDFQINDNDGVNNGSSIIGNSGISPGYIYDNTYLDNTSPSLSAGTQNWVVSGVSKATDGYIATW
jgi:hypothetical protein